MALCEERGEGKKFIDFYQRGHRFDASNAPASFPPPDVENQRGKDQRAGKKAGPVFDRRLN